MIFAQTARPDRNEPAPTLSVKMALKVAMQNDGLVKAMYAQLDPRFIQDADQRIYTAKVLYRNVSFVIWGTKLEWKHFFNGHSIDPAGTAG